MSTPYVLTSISLRVDEQEALAELMKKCGLNRHAVIKLALRRFLFPDEKTSIPLNGHTATVQDSSVTVKPSSDAEDPFPFADLVEKPKTVHDDFIFP